MPPLARGSPARYGVAAKRGTPWQSARNNHPYRPVAFVGYVHDVRLKRHAIDHGAREDGVVGISVPQSKGGFMIVISESFSLGMAVHEINPVAVYATMAT